MTSSTAYQLLHRPQMFNQAWSIFHYSKDESGSLTTTAALKNILLRKDVTRSHTALQGCVMPLSRTLDDRGYGCVMPCSRTPTDRDYWPASLRIAKELHRKFYTFVIGRSSFEDSCFSLLLQLPQSPHEHTTINSLKFCNRVFPLFFSACFVLHYY